MELYQLRSFVTIVRTGSFTQAAEELFLTQPALSLQIKALEEGLGEPVFERKGRKLLLTPAGHLLRERAEQILGLIQTTNQEIDALKGLQHGTLNIGTNDSNCLYLLPDLIQQFRRQYPHIEIHLANSHSSQVAGWVREGRVEFGVVTLPILDPQLESQILFTREDVLICQPDHPLGRVSTVTPKELVAYPLLLLDKGSVSHTMLTQTLAQANQTPGTVMQVGSIEVIKRYVEIGLGVSVVPRLNAELEIRAGRLRAIRLDWLPVSLVGIVQRRKGYLSPAARVFLDMLKTHLPETL
jgi:DNA-binding transcriptional LysR family regulator